MAPMTKEFQSESLHLEQLYIGKEIFQTLRQKMSQLRFCFLCPDFEVLLCVISVIIKNIENIYEKELYSRIFSGQLRHMKKNS